MSEPSSFGRSLVDGLAIVGAVVASVAVAAAGLYSNSPVKFAAIGGVLGVGLWLLVAQSPDRVLLLLIFLVAPMEMTKTVVSLTDVKYLADAPGFEISVIDLPMALLIVRWLWNRRRLAIPFFPRLTGFDIAALAFLGWIWISAGLSPARDTALASAADYSKFVVYFLVLSHLVKTPEDWRAVIRGTCVGLAITLALAAMQIATRNVVQLPGVKIPLNLEPTVALGTSDVGFRPVAYFQHPNTLANYLVLVMPPALTLFLLGRLRVRPSVRLLSLFALLGSSIALVATLSRGGWASAFLGSLVCILALWRVGCIKGRALIVGGLGGLAMLAVIAVSVPSIWLRISGPDSRSMEGRRLLVQQAFEIIADKPLVGSGFGAYNRVSQAYTPPGFAYVEPDFQKAVRGIVVHNHYLLVAGELGIPALLLYCGMWLGLLRRLLPLRQWTDMGRLALVIGLAGSMCGNLLYFQSDNYYLDVRVAHFWMLAGLIQALLITQRRSLLEAERNSQLVRA